MVADLLNRKSTHFVLWAPKPGAQPPRLILGELQLTNPVSLANEQSIAMTAVAGVGRESLFAWETKVYALV